MLALRFKLRLALVLLRLRLAVMRLRLWLRRWVAHRRGGGDSGSPRWRRAIGVRRVERRASAGESGVDFGPYRVHARKSIVHMNVLALRRRRSVRARGGTEVDAPTRCRSRSLLLLLLLPLLRQRLRLP